MIQLIGPINRNYRLNKSIKIILREQGKIKRQMRHQDSKLSKTHVSINQKNLSKLYCNNKENSTDKCVTTFLPHFSYQWHLNRSRVRQRVTPSQPPLHTHTHTHTHPHWVFLFPTLTKYEDILNLPVLTPVNYYGRVFNSFLGQKKIMCGLEDKVALVPIIFIVIHMACNISQLVRTTPPKVLRELSNSEYHIICCCHTSSGCQIET